MPIGALDPVPHIARSLMGQRPARVLDLGLGSGFYGAVVRQWIDHGVQPWKTWLVGVEAWAAYRNPLWDLYNAIYTMPIEQYLAEVAEAFDCVLLNDVLEHFDQRDGIHLIKHLQSAIVAPGGTLWIGTPAYFFEQEDVYGNERERHRSAWTAADLEQLGFQTVLSGHEPQVGPIAAVLARWDHPGTTQVG